MENTTIVEKNRKTGKRRRKDKSNNSDKKNVRPSFSKDESEPNETNENIEVSADSETTKDINQDHLYSATKSKKMKRKLSVATEQSENNKKRNKAAIEPDSCVSTMDANKTFKCDKCGAQSVTNPLLRGNRLKTGKHTASPRRKVDPETNRILCLCNACGLKFDRTKKARNRKLPPSLEEKQKYLDEGQRFAEVLAEELNNKEAERLFCTYYTKTPCGCIQRYIGNDKSVSSIERAKTLLEIMAKAKHYKMLKVYENKDDDDTQNNNDSTEDGISNKQKKKPKKNFIGLGNGHKKSVKFEKFVLEQRAWLKKKFGFCEIGTKRVLLYSNNYLHKKLKTEPEKSCRIARQKGLAALGKLIPIDDLPKEHCCVDNCVRMAQTHPTLLQQWRDRAITGQIEARRVIAEMLTPSGGSRANCYKFVCSVTGVSVSTIGKVMEQMKKTGGNREPPKHGLIKYWKQNPKPKKNKNEAKQSVLNKDSSFTKDNPPAMFPTATFVHPYGILQAAANSSGLAAVMQGQQQQQQQQPQQGQTVTSNPQNNTTIINVPTAPYLQSYIKIPTGPLAIPVNALQMQNFQIQHQLQQPQFQLIQQQSHQQQQPQQQQQQPNSPAIAIAVNPVPNVRQQLTVPTMVSSAAAQPGTFVFAPATSTFMETDACITTAQQLAHLPTPQGGLQLPAQFLITSGQGASLMLPNNPSGLISLVAQTQPQHMHTNGGGIVMAPASASTTTEQFLSAENGGLLCNTTAAQVPVSQFTQLIQQSPGTAIGATSQQIVNQVLQQQQPVSFISHNQNCFD